MLFLRHGISKLVHVSGGDFLYNDFGIWHAELSVQKRREILQNYLCFNAYAVLLLESKF